jgi:hypothetical protein
MEKAVKSAFGFWLFLIEAFGLFTKYGKLVRNPRWGIRKLKDLSTHYSKLRLPILPHDHPEILRPYHWTHSVVGFIRKQGEAPCMHFGR